MSRERLVKLEEANRVRSRDIREAPRSEGSRSTERPNAHYFATASARRHSNVDDHVTLRPGAADQDISFCRWVERIRLIGDGPGDQSALAVVADAGAARPSDRHVTRFRQFKKALILRRTPTNGETAACEGHPWPYAGGACRLMRCAHRGWRRRQASAKDYQKRPRNESGPQARPRRSGRSSDRRGSSMARRDRSRHLARRAGLGGPSSPDDPSHRSPVPPDRPHPVGCTRCGSARERAFREVAAPRLRKRVTYHCGRRAATRPHEVNVVAARAWSMASTGVAPIPALRSTAGPSPGCKVKLPLGSLTSRTSPARTLLFK